MTTNRAAKDILGLGDKESELLQSFVRVGLRTDGDDEDKRASIMTSSPKKADLYKQLSENSSSDGKTPRKSKKDPGKDQVKMKRRNRQREFFEEVYTDKDRAAAVSFGFFDIKQSLSQKARQDRNEALSLPEEAEPGALLALGLRECKNGKFDSAVQFISKALELNSSDQNALVARSRCYLLLGEPAKAINDAETALLSDKNNIRAIYQKAEALYYLGQFEHSLMFFHRGLRLRPDANFRLGVQKTQEAIENTIGVSGSRAAAVKSKSARPKSNGGSGQATTANSTARGSSVKEVVNKVSGGGGGGSERGKTAKLSRSDMEKKASRRLLGELCVDKEYLENLLKHPDLKRADTETEEISTLAKEAVSFLNNREEFWRQQRSCTALINKRTQREDSVCNEPGSSRNMPKWY